MPVYPGAPNRASHSSNLRSLTNPLQKSFTAILFESTGAYCTELGLPPVMMVNRLELTVDRELEPLIVVYRYSDNRLCQNENWTHCPRPRFRFCFHSRTTSFTAMELCAKLKIKQTVA